MKTVQMTIDETLLNEVDQIIQSLNTTRSAFIRDALQMALRQYRIGILEQRHAAGYARQPETDVAEWESEQAWGDQ
ncbi:MAG TPA: ribbon-helix-helix domain-containing protein [Anaerolineae bacterium]|nr:ribbon-helix-helix domain-containing protein [Anaerolineae bacterium]HQI87192.1 ribbon-helix-helix domain-containing protein [Anaerolineae bacterium]